MRLHSCLCAPCLYPQVQLELVCAARSSRRGSGATNTGVTQRNHYANSTVLHITVHTPLPWGSVFKLSHVVPLNLQVCYAMTFN